MAGPQFQVVHVAANQAGETVLAVLRSSLPDKSWSQLRRLISQRRLQINGNLCIDEDRRVKAGDVLRVSQQSLAAPVVASDVRIVHLDDQIVVVDKPPGVTTLRHSQERDWPEKRKQRQATLDELVDQLLAATSSQPQGEGPHRRRMKTKRAGHVRAVHRLDRDTSGLLVFARSVEAEVELIRQFKKHTVERAYVAIVHGRIEATKFDSYLVRDRGDGLRGSSESSAVDAERAITHVRPLEYLNGYSVVECRLETGRTHQIRIHLSEAGHMLCGEKTYIHSPAGRLVEDTSGATRQALHAAVLGLVHPTSGGNLHWVSPLPPDMLKLLERLRELPTITRK